MNNSHIYETLFRSHFRLAVLYAEQFVGSQDAAEDIVQEVFVGLLNVDLSSIRDSRSYLFRCVRNASFNYLQLHPAGRYFTLDSREAVFASAVQEDYSEAENSETLKRLGALYEQVENLPPRARQIFKMIAIEKLSYAETAKQLSISIHSVKTHMSRSFQALRKRVGKL